MEEQSKIGRVKAGFNVEDEQRKACSTKLEAGFTWNTMEDMRELNSQMPSIFHSNL